MKITRKLEIALKALACLKGRTTPVNCQELAVSAGTTIHFVEQVMGKLRRAQLVVVQRGPGGGYTLASGTITAAEVAVAIGQKVSTNSNSGPTGDLQRAIFTAYMNTAI